MRLLKFIKSFVPLDLRRRIRSKINQDRLLAQTECNLKVLPIYLRWLPFYKMLRCRYQHNRRIRRIIESNKVKVAFVVSSLSMWRSQKLVERLQLDNRFEICIILLPFASFSEEEKKISIDTLKNNFDNLGQTYIDATDNKFDANQLISEFDPDIIFYQQHFAAYPESPLNWPNLSERLISYIPYGLTVSKKSWSFNNYMTNLGWMIFFPNQFEIQLAKKECINKGRNIVNVGDIHYEMIKSSKFDPWLKVDPNHIRKRIIWAPHFSVISGGALNFDSFLWLASFIKEYVIRNSDHVVLAFKPHPRLKSFLKLHSEWGELRTSQYFSELCSLSNVLYEENEYCDLFAHADAIIHDSGSFIGEALYGNMSCCYTARNIEYNLSVLNDFAKSCLQCYYIASNCREVEDFIESVVSGQADSLKLEQKSFSDKILKPINAGVTENIYAAICNGLGLTLRSVN